MKLDSFNKFIKLNEQYDDDEIRFTGKLNKDQPRMYDEYHDSRMELLLMFKHLNDFIKSSNPIDELSYNDIKRQISIKKDEILRHPQFLNLKQFGFPMQDTTLKLDAVNKGLEESIILLSNKAKKRRLI
jgi:hypothetical protein